VVYGFSPKPGAKAPGYGFFAEINTNIVFWLPVAAEAEPVEAKHRVGSGLLVKP